MIRHNNLYIYIYITISNLINVKSIFNFVIFYEIVFLKAFFFCILEHYIRAVAMKYNKIIKKNMSTFLYDEHFNLNVK